MTDKKFVLINKDNLDVIAEISDFEVDYNVNTQDMLIKPLQPSGIRFPGVNSPFKHPDSVHIPEAGLDGAAGKFHHEDSIFLLREIYLMQRKLLKLLGDVEC